MPLSVPAKTRSPTCLATGNGSPVSADSSTEVTPAMTSPSTGTRSPGRRTTATRGGRARPARSVRHRVDHVRVVRREAHEGGHGVPCAGAAPRFEDWRWRKGGDRGALRPLAEQGGAGDGHEDQTFMSRRRDAGVPRGERCGEPGSAAIPKSAMLHGGWARRVEVAKACRTLPASTTCPTSAGGGRWRQAKARGAAGGCLRSRPGDGAHAQGGDRSRSLRRARRVEGTTSS